MHMRGLSMQLRDLPDNSDVRHPSGLSTNLIRSHQRKLVPTVTGKREQLSRILDLIAGILWIKLDKRGASTVERARASSATTSFASLVQ